MSLAYVSFRDDQLGLGQHSSISMLGSILLWFIEGLTLSGALIPVFYTDLFIFTTCKSDRIIEILRNAWA